MCMRKKEKKEVKVSVGLRITFFVNEEMFQYTTKSRCSLIEKDVCA